jgi:hypothetical protein
VREAHSEFREICLAEHYGTRFAEPRYRWTLTWRHKVLKRRAPPSRAQPLGEQIILDRDWQTRQRPFCGGQGRNIRLLSRIFGKNGNESTKTSSDALRLLKHRINKLSRVKLLRAELAREQPRWDCA